MAMEKSEFIPILTCALQSADPRITGIEFDHLNPEKVTVRIDDGSSLKININGLPLLHVLGYVTWVVVNNLGERSLPAIKSKISRRGIQFDGEWYWSEPLLMRHGQTVWIHQNFRADTIEIYDNAENLIETFQLG